MVDTTQSLARSRAAWSAVTTDEQTAGRGQRDRSFVSDPGGLYLTAVLPYDGDPLATRGFALAVGWAVRATLLRAGVRDVRLRWPNDLMIETRKIGGILVEQGTKQTLLVGLGLNYSNQPWRADPALREIAGRLVDAASADTLPSRAELAQRLLRAIGLAYHIFARKRLEGFVPILNRDWGQPRRVRLELLAGIGPTEIEGLFLGIGLKGNLLLHLDDGTQLTVPENHVSRLREINPPTINSMPGA